MKFSFKLKALAVGAMMLVGGAASASGIDTTNGDVILNLFDATTGYTFVYDTGVNETTFSSASGYSFNVASDANYQAFMSGVGASGDTIEYNVIAVGATAAYSTSVGTPSSVKNSNVNNGLSFGASYIDSVNQVSTSTTNSYYAGASSPNAQWTSGTTTDTGWSNNFKTSQDSTVGSALNFYSIAFNGTNHTSTFTNAVITQFASTWLLDSAGNLTYGAVPIPAPFGLLLGGLALMGVISRRKSGTADQNLGGAAA